MRDELGVAAYRRAMHQALVALGDTVIAEAERLAGASARARAPSGTVVPFCKTSRVIRRRGNTADPDGSKRRAKRMGSFRLADMSTCGVAKVWRSS
ncbi:hypothetical protein [Methylobacterium sp. Leaf102]|uniref:hypothetical protein n=1 Tax=Methylobacterium sp. Leaf102 TaxID=1736253 RepID=UPI0012E846D9|nr:hypothetical protein [Methylobacterium sp. Leaf102]